MLVILLGAGSPARADVLARSGRLLLRADRRAVFGSQDGGGSWQRWAGLASASEGAPGEALDDDEEDTPEPPPLRLVALGGRALLGGPTGLALLEKGASPIVITREPCRDLLAEGDRAAALCGQRILWTVDAGRTFAERPAPPGARSIAWPGAGASPLAFGARAAVAAGSEILRAEAAGVVDRHGAVRLAGPTIRLRAEGNALLAWGPDGAWLSRDQGRSFGALVDAEAYELQDLVPDGEAGAWAWTDVGLVHLATEDELEEPAGAAQLLPSLALAARWEQIGPARGWAVVAVATFPLGRALSAPVERASAAARARATGLRARASRLAILARRKTGRATRSDDRRQRERRLLRVQELRAQAHALVEAAR